MRRFSAFPRAPDLQAGAAPRARPIDNLRGAADATRHDRQSRLLRFDERQTKWLRRGIRLTEEIRRGQHRGYVFALAEEANAMRDPGS